MAGNTNYFGFNTQEGEQRIDCVDHISNHIIIFCFLEWGSEFPKLPWLCQCTETIRNTGLSLQYE